MRLNLMANPDVCLDVTRAKEFFGFEARWQFRDGRAPNLN